MRNSLFLQRPWIFLVLYSVIVAMEPLGVQRALGCATELQAKSAHVKKPTAWAKHWKSKRAGRRIASVGDTSWSKDQLWGGQNPKLWKPEAVLANAVSDALARGYSEFGAQDVLVSVPLKMLYGSDRPYGDGQTNASISFGNFGSSGDSSQDPNAMLPPVVASWISYSYGSKKLEIRFQNMRDLDLSKPGQLIYFANGNWTTHSLGVAQKNLEGSYDITWTADGSSITWGDLFQNRVAYFQAPGKTDVFPIDFRNVVTSNSDLLSQVVPAKRNLGTGTLLDPENASVQSQDQSSVIPFDILTKKNFATDLKASHYTPVVGIHNAFHTPDGVEHITAVGNGDTTVILPPQSPFKMAYICFDARNIAAERSADVGGVPSGAGWHEIGDPAETVINSLETAAPIFGYANGKPGMDLPSKQIAGGYAFGLTDVAVIRKLKPGQALVTAAGPTTSAEGFSDARGKGEPSGRNYHWFIFDQPHEVCAVEWVHPCIPNESNSLGMSCGQ